MGPGYLAIAFAAKPAAPKVPLWVLLVASEGLVLLRFGFVAMGVEKFGVSHWVLDFIVHPGELPLLFNGSPTVGLGLWTSGPGLILSGILEIALLTGGAAIYWVARKPKPLQGFG